MGVRVCYDVIGLRGTRGQEGARADEDRGGGLELDIRGGGFEAREGVSEGSRGGGGGRGE